MSKKLVSIVIPVYNSESTIEPVCRRLFSVFSSLNYDLEIVLVDDGSRDKSWEVLKNLAHSDGRIKALTLMRNFTEHNAVMAGLNNASGDYIVIMDDDGQNPPEDVPLFLSEVEKGYDVVYSYYSKKKHNVFRNLGSRFNDVVASFLLKKPPDLYLSSFKIMDRLLKDQIIKYKGPYPYIDGLILRSTRNISKVLMRHEDRQVGRSNYTFGKLVSLWLNMFTNFSIMPLRLATIAGFVFSVVGLLMGVYFILEKIENPAKVMGYYSIVVLVVCFSGIQLFIIGMIGEYLGRMFLSSNETPQFIIREKAQK